MLEDLSLMAKTSVYGFRFLSLLGIQCLFSCIPLGFMSNRIEGTLSFTLLNVLRLSKLLLGIFVESDVVSVILILKKLDFWFTYVDQVFSPVLLEKH